MPLGFAATRLAVHSPIARALGRRALTRAANDNGESGAADEPLLHAALRHFGSHGMGAAQAAYDEAIRALSDGNRQDYDWWLGICRTLDRRLATRLSSLHRAAETR
jgi:hypothetical protein